MTLPGRARGLAVWLAAGLLLAGAGGAPASPRVIASPPLESLDGQKIVLTVPAGTAITSRDETADWKHVEYDFTVSKPGLKGPLDGVVLQWSRSRAERKAFCHGKLVKVGPGVKAWFSEVGFVNFRIVPVSESDTTYHAMCIPRPHQVAIVVECITPTAENATWKSTVEAVFRSVRFE